MLFVRNQRNNHVISYSILRLLLLLVRKCNVWQFLVPKDMCSIQAIKIEYGNDSVLKEIYSSYRIASGLPNGTYTGEQYFHVFFIRTYMREHAQD